MNCHLLIPSLFPPRTLTRGNDPLDQARAPVLQVLLARARHKEHPPRDLESWLCAAFGVERRQNYPVASLRLLADGIEPGNGYWLCADPVHLAVEREQVILSQVALRAEEADSLVAMLNRHFAADGLAFAAPHPDRWYLRVDPAPDIVTRPLSEAVGNNIHPLLPSGREERRWRTLLNEMQMALFAHPVNAAREARGEAPVNSIWLWGGGVLPHGLTQPFDGLWSDDPFARGLGLASGVTSKRLPATGGAWLEQASAGNHLVLLDQLLLPASYGNPQLWRERLAELEQAWFAPLKQAVASGAVALTLHTPAADGTQDFAISRLDLWKFWNPARALWHYRQEK